jgi:hypothetical protein
MVDFNAPSQQMAAIASLLFPFVSAVLLERRFPASLSASARFITFWILYAVLLVVPIHILAALELMNWIGPLRPAFWMMAQAILCAISVAVTRTAGKPFPPLPSLGQYKDLLPPACALACCYGLLLLNLLTSYPGGFDGLVYQLPLALRWLQDGSLALTPGWPWQFSQPANGNIPMMILLATGFEPLATIFNSVLAVVLGVSVYLLAQRLGADRFGSLLAALIVLSIPIVMFQSVDAYVDLFAATFFTAALALFLHSGSSATALLYAAFAAGLAAGARPAYWLWSALLIAGMLVYRWFRDPRRRLATLLIVTVGAGTPSLFWLARGMATTGNPFYPLPHIGTSASIESDRHAGSPFGATPLSPSRRPADLAFWLLYPWTEFKRVGYNYGPDSGLGAAFATLVPVALFFRFWRLGFNRDERGSLAGLLALMLIVATVVWWFAMLRIFRFALPLLPVATALGSPVWDRIRATHRRAFSVLLAACFIATAMLASLEPIHSLGGRLRTGDPGRAAFYGLPDLIDHLPRGTRILGAPEVMNFGMAGPRLDLRLFANFEAPSPWSPDVIRRLDIDYVVERRASPEIEPVMRHLNATLVFDRASDPAVSPRVLVDRVWRIGKTLSR